MFRLALTEDRWLRLFAETDAAELHDVIGANREHLARWLPWAVAQALEDTAAFIARTRAQLEKNDGFQVAVVESDAIIGAVGFACVSWQPSLEHDRLLAGGVGARPGHDESRVARAGRTRFRYLAASPRRYSRGRRQ
jgi:RimJ/RimL family protein N-acetyltransferase